MRASSGNGVKTCGVCLNLRITSIYAGPLYVASWPHDGLMKVGTGCSSNVRIMLDDQGQLINRF